jgi:predicted small secreted protein
MLWKMSKAIILSLFLVACTPSDSCINTTESAMQGEEVRIRAQAYIEMCQRNPKSVLCTTEFDNE